MLNNINSNSPAFGANLKITTAVKDSARLENIKKVFEEKTPEFKETLSLTRLGEDWNNLEYLHMGTKPESDTGSFFKNSFDSIMESFSDNEIVTKLIKGLKTLKAAKKREGAFYKLEEQRYVARNEKQRNTLLAESCQKRGDDVMSKRFEFLANCFDKKIKKIDKESEAINNKFLNKLTEIANGDEDILYLKESIL